MDLENKSDEQDAVTNLRLQLHHVTIQRDHMEVLVNHYKEEAFRYKMLLAKRMAKDPDEGFIK